MANKDTHITEVVFRHDKVFGVFALFPYELYNNYSGSVISYARIGQHSAANYDGCIKSSRPATEDEYRDLFKELEFIGYNLKVIKRQNFAKYLKVYNSAKTKSLGFG